MKYEPQFAWDETAGIASCILTDGNIFFCGTASCHSDDADMMSEKTGCEIAYRRAKIESFKYYRNTLKQQLKALNQLYYSMNQSQKFNPKSYENRMLQRQIQMIKLDLDTVNEMLVGERQKLKTYIDEKDKFYNQIRKMRKQVKT